MPGPKRTNTQWIVKTFHFQPSLVEDMERVIYLTRDKEEAKYTSMTNLVVVALSDLIQRERRLLEREGVVWDHLKPNFKQSLNKE